MIIHNIKIRNFKSCYGEHSFDFDKLNGLVKLSGPIGSGKTTLGEAIIWGLYGTIKGQNNGQLVSWNCKECEIELNLSSKNKDIHIIRNILKPLIIEINGKTLSASNKRDTQSILEEELLDVPKLAVIKMCIISFNQFNSLASMNPNETKMFLDEIFGFKLFSDYNNEVVLERKNEQNEIIKLQALYDENIQQIEYLKSKQLTQTSELEDSIDIEKLNLQKQNIINKGLELKKKKEEQVKERKEKEKEYSIKIKNCQAKMTEAMTLGKQAKEQYNTFKSGYCPTCGHEINKLDIEKYKNVMTTYANDYKNWQASQQEFENECSNMINEYNKKIESIESEMSDLRSEIGKIDSEIKSYENSVKLINENYDSLIDEYTKKGEEIKKQLDRCDIEIGEWNEMNELFSKTLRYKLLDTLIPHINKSIQYYINKLEQNYHVVYDQEFKAHIYVDGFGKEIAYNNLSTGQRKSLDLAIIFGILQNVIANVNVNILFLDELFSNMDINARNIMLSLLNESLSEDKTIFIINHAEMNDDFFSHKIRVHLENRKIKSTIKDVGDVIIRCSKYEQIF